MSRRLSLHRRGERLEAILPNPAATAYRNAMVVIGIFDGDRHLV
jgi:hypothetical protein